MTRHVVKRSLQFLRPTHRDSLNVQIVHKLQQAVANGDVAVVLFNPSETATKLSFELSDVGFAPYSHVRVTDVLGGSDGSATGKWVRAEYETETPVAPHGSATLRLAFTPRYPEL